MPVFGMKPASYESFTEFKTRDIVLLGVGIDGRPVPGGAALELRRRRHGGKFEDRAAGHAGYSRISVAGADGPVDDVGRSARRRKYPRGNYCTRGARYGVHSSEENFRNPYYGKLTFLAYFTGGVRVWDIREPQAPVEVAFYVPEANANTDPDGYMTNNLEVDNRGFIYVVDRNGAGMDILQLTGKALDIAFPAARPLR